MSKVTFLGLGKQQKEQSHEFLGIYLQPQGSSKQIYGSTGHNGPAPTGIGLMGGLSWFCAQKWIKETRDVGAIAFSLQPVLTVDGGAVPCQTILPFYINLENCMITALKSVSFYT